MLGDGSSSSSTSTSQGSGGAFSCSSSAALPPARRHHQQTAASAAAAAAAAAIVAASTCWSPTNPFNVLASGGSVVVPSTASEEATVEAAAVPPHFTYANACTTTQPIQQRKRPGCSCDHDDYQSVHATSGAAGAAYYDYPLAGDCEHVEPLDLSLPKVKVRQHWSGGSIVQVNESTIISIDRRPDALADLCCSGCAPSDVAGRSPSRLNVSVVTVPHQRPSCWTSSSAFQQATIDRHPFRLQIEIPFGASDEKALPGFLRHPPPPHRRKSVHTSNNNNPLASSCSNSNSSSSGGGDALPLHPPEIATSVMTDVAREDDDLQRLSIVAHQLRLSGYYYGHLSWKESMQLLQNTKVGTFLVRDSSDARYLYALSLQTDKGPTSVRIHYSSRGFRLDASNTGMADHLPRFRTVLDLVDHYVAKWSQCRDKGQFWLDNSGQVHSEVVLIRPLMRDCPPLKHLCRLAWNCRRSTSANSSLSPSSSANIPPTIKSFLNEYPFQH
ncbi:uncharacterized protein LOC130700726 [Daphnia carinata]|uniref:uncharacterized protein LOC130700726 n=1 Tax=Daphnia carinata TaxID=120202 RepID=UPI002579B9EF|nr:uncharacterized protein LOC130700726 [Daphnia carinata]